MFFIQATLTLENVLYSNLLGQLHVNESVWFILAGRDTAAPNFPLLVPVYHGFCLLFTIHFLGEERRRKEERREMFAWRITLKLDGNQCHTGALAST